jgi:hypothetical protein
MMASDIQNFSDGRTKARAYFCYLFSKNIQNRLPALTQDLIVPSLLKIKADLEKCEGVYLLDSRGVQVSPTFTATAQIDDDAGRIRADRAYFYRAVKEARCTITDPYPSLITGDLTVTASQPIYDEHGELKFVACLDMPLNEVIKISRSTIFDKFFNNLFRYSYAIFSFALVGVALLLFLKGIQSFFVYEITPEHFQIKDVFEATILITLALAIFDLAKTLIEEELLGRNSNNSISGPHKTMVRFLGSIIIALSIEALMLVFKFAITDPEKILYAMYIIAGVSLLLITLAVYIKFTKLKIEE